MGGGCIRKRRPVTWGEGRARATRGRRGLMSSFAPTASRVFSSAPMPRTGEGPGASGGIELRAGGVSPGSKRSGIPCLELFLRWNAGGYPTTDSGTPTTDSGAASSLELARRRLATRGWLPAGGGGAAGRRRWILLLRPDRAPLPPAPPPAAAFGPRPVDSSQAPRPLVPVLLDRHPVGPVAAGGRGSSRAPGRGDEGSGPPGRPCAGPARSRPLPRGAPPTAGKAGRPLPPPSSPSPWRRNEFEACSGLKPDARLGYDNSVTVSYRFGVTEALRLRILAARAEAEESSNQSPAALAALDRLVSGVSKFPGAAPAGHGAVHVATAGVRSFLAREILQKAGAPGSVPAEDLAILQLRAPGVFKQLATDEAVKGALEEHLRLESRGHALVCDALFFLALERGERAPRRERLEADPRFAPIVGLMREELQDEQTAQAAAASVVAPDAEPPAAAAASSSAAASASAAPKRRRRDREREPPREKKNNKRDYADSYRTALFFNGDEAAYLRSYEI
eukprot:tig00020510_g9879.t1